ncbi:hypothetical protein ACNKHN_10460 [Shigella flexneri]
MSQEELMRRKNFVERLRSWVAKTPEATLLYNTLQKTIKKLRLL